jgi:hypothetical protein
VLATITLVTKNWSVSCSDNWLDIFPHNFNGNFSSKMVYIMFQLDQAKEKKSFINIRCNPHVIRSQSNKGKQNKLYCSPSISNIYVDGGLPLQHPQFHTKHIFLIAQCQFHVLASSMPSFFGSDMSSTSMAYHLNLADNCSRPSCYLLILALYNLFFPFSITGSIDEISSTPTYKRKQLH